MKISRIRLTNFRNHRDTEIELDRLNIFCGPNASGKSSIKQALEICLTGRCEATEELRPLLEAILAKLDALADRPIDIAVTTQLDGRQIAQSVYRDLRERKIKNYETL